MLWIGIIVAVFAAISIYSLLTYFYGSHPHGIHHDRLSRIRDSIHAGSSIRVEGHSGQDFGNDAVSVSGEKMNYHEVIKAAGNRRYVVPVYKMAIAIVICVILGGALLWTMYRSQVDTTSLLLAGVAMGGLILYLPRLMYLQQKKKIAEEVSLTFPNAIDLLNVCLEAGGGFDQSLFRVAFEIKQMAPLLSEEFIRVNYEINAGKSREKALTDMALRFGVDEVTAVVTNIIQAEKLGGSLVGSLRVQAETLRDKVKQRMRTKIAKVPIKLIFPMALTLLPVIMLIILGPVMISIYRNIVVK